MMILIIRFTGSPTNRFKFITKCDGLLLQSATGLLLQRGRVLLQSEAILLQSAIGITKSDGTRYTSLYKE